MRKVHDIVIGRKKGKAVLVVSFIQHGEKATGYIYENICPFCATTLEKVTANPAAEMSAVLKRLQAGMDSHINVCPRRGAQRLEVEKTATPLNTEKLIREH